ncbi:amidohydrolase family protein [Salinispora sp. H7-4]|uniref:metal-dependent hydrolase family protein n=1 Tax=Salinispora sp. H7-4 TaxID=2748321 RepID=UPI0015D3741A|nr:amidohydrolase family protein [Salinispora sp. H7-4]NYT96244.1 amidohydrolase family protein [Salinispora sp. H7-4]
MGLATTQVETIFDPRLAIRAARLFDGYLLHDGPVLLLVAGGQITDVDVTGAAPPHGVPMTDLGDVTLLPGLVDAHTHLAFDPQGRTEHQMVHDDDATVLGRMREHAARALRAGITTVRDLGDRGYLSLRLRAEYAEDTSGPQVLAAGPPITRSGGHCWYLGGEADDTDQLVAAVHARADRGTDLLKIMATGGMTTSGSNAAAAQYTLDELRAVTRTAHDRGLPVIAHAHATRGITDAVTAGVDSIEHCTFMTADGLKLDPATVDAIAAAGIFVGCTVVRPRDSMPEEVLRTIAPYWENQAYLRRRGVRVVCCTDAGISQHKPHDILPSDVGYFASQVGTNAEALASVTSLAAQACRLGHRKGRVAVGYDADLLAVAGNPVTDITALVQTRAVFRAGKRVH